MPRIRSAYDCIDRTIFDSEPVGIDTKTLVVL